MANTLMSLLVSLGIDSSSFDKGLDDAEKKGQSAASNIGKGLAQVGGVVAGSMAAAAAATGAFLASTIGPASDLNETVSKIGVVFGEQSAAVLKFGEASASALGMSENAALSAAGTYGNLFRAMGITEKASADMSMGLVTLAGDLASFNNMNPEEVLDKLRAGLSGETEPLRSLGVNINQAAIEAKALSAGLWDGIAPLSAAAKAQATYALIMEQTTLAQGDFGRTSKGLANQQRILAANLENLKAKIGTALLLAVNKIAEAMISAFNSPLVQQGLDALVAGLNVFTAFVVDNIPVAIAAFQGLVKFFQDNQGVIVGILAALTVALVAFLGSVAAAAWAAVVPFLPVIAVMAAVGVAAYLLYQAWQSNFGGIQDIVKNFASFFEKNFLPVLKTAWDWIQKNLLPLFKALGDLISTSTTLAFQGLGLVFQTLLYPELVKLWSVLSKNVFPILKIIAEIVIGQMAAGFRNMTIMINAATSALQSLAQWLASIKIPSWLSAPPQKPPLGGTGGTGGTSGTTPPPNFGAPGGQGFASGGGSGAGLTVTFVIGGEVSESRVSQMLDNSTGQILRSLESVLRSA